MNGAHEVISVRRWKNDGLLVARVRLLRKPHTRMTASCYDCLTTVQFYFHDVF